MKLKPSKKFFPLFLLALVVTVFYGAGFRLFFAEGASMQPALSYYSVGLFDSRVSSLREGDVIAYESLAFGAPSSVLHRVVGLTVNGFRVCGDNLDRRVCEDVLPNQILGRQVASFNL